MDYDVLGFGGDPDGPLEVRNNQLDNILFLLSSIP